MKIIRVRNTTKNTELANRCAVASSFWARTVGLLNRRSLGAGEGLLFERCASIHTMGMRFAIDVVFLDGDGRVLRTAAKLKPWRVAAACRGARTVLELPAGAIDAGRTEKGDELRFEPVG